MGGEKVMDLDVVMECSRCIARERSELAYSWDSDRVGKTEIIDNGISVH